MSLKRVRFNRVLEGGAESPVDGHALGRARHWARALGLSLAAALLAGTVGGSLAARLQVNDSPARGHAAVIAHGVVSFPAGDRLTLEAQDGDLAAYYAIELVENDPPADLDFASPGGRRDLDLVRDVLAPGEEGELPDSGQPTLVLATEGEIEIETEAGDGDPTTLRSGEAALFAGELVVTGASVADASYVAVVIGPEIAGEETTGTGGGPPGSGSSGGSGSGGSGGTMPTPTGPDTDGDGLADAHEATAGTDPLDPTSTP